MIRSMTAFARRDSQLEEGLLSWEIRSVNHRYLEVFARLPEDFRSLDGAVRERVGKYLKRGKVDCSLAFRRQAATQGQLQLNHDMAHQLARLSREVDAMVFNAAPVSSIEILKWPGVLETAPVDMDVIHHQALDLLEEALEEMVSVRSREGEGLQRVIEERCAQIRRQVAGVRERMPVVIQALRERLTARIEELKVEADPDRLAQEIAFLTQKLDVDEEMQRLDAHVEEVLRVVGGKKPEAIGRRLDFLMQELNREANTLCSKSADAETTQAGVELKVLIEQMREQVQNIE